MGLNLTGGDAAGDTDDNDMSQCKERSEGTAEPKEARHRR